jgi:hypothetical protein
MAESFIGGNGVKRNVGFGASLITVTLFLIPDLLVMADDLVDNEAQKLFGKVGIELCFMRQLPEPFDLLFFTRRISRGQAGRCFIFAHCLRHFEALGEHENERSIDIVNAASKSRKGQIFIHVTALPRHSVRDKGFCSFCTCHFA